MIVTVAVGLVALLAAVAAALASTASRHLDPLDTSDEERGLVRRLARYPRLRRFLGRRLDRRTAGGLVLTVGLLVAFVTAAVAGLVVDMIDTDTGLARFDAAVAHWGADHAGAAAIGPITAVTHLGDTLTVIVALAAAVVVDLVRRRRWDVVLFAVAVLGGEKILVNGLKGLVDRPRPDVLHLVEAVGSSFPSGHSGAAAAVWPAVALILGRSARRPVRIALSTAAVLVAVAVAASRALLGVHWLTDVVAGAAIGYGWFLLVATVFGGRAQRLGAPVSDRPAHTPAR